MNWSYGRLSRIRDQLLSRDDLRTRSEAASAVFREGGRGGTAGELCEDGADDHPLKQWAANSRVCGETGREHSLAARDAHRWCWRQNR